VTPHLLFAYVCRLLAATRISREAELQRQMRFETIAKANEKLYEQTDKIKSLRSGQLYGEVIETRNAQVQNLST
jgi:hypothetical protein